MATRTDLAGKLSTIGLAEVFQNIAFNNHSGTLSLEQRGKKSWIAFEGGKVRAVKVAGTEVDYVDLARRAELASDEVLEKAANPNRRRTLKAFLLASGDLDEARYDALIGGVVEELVLPLFGWKAASFSFAEGGIKERTFDKEQLGCNVALDPTGVAMEAARRLDEWETLENWVPTDKDVLVHTGAVVEVELPEGADRLLPLLDGTRNFGQVVAEARLKEYDVCKICATLVEWGLLVPATPERVRELAVQARTSGNVALAARRLEVALELEPGSIETRHELVRLHERAGRMNDAAREQRRLAEVQVEQGDTEGAIESYERATVLAPDDLDLLERILSLHEQRNETTRALKVGRKLASTLVAQEMYEDALPLYERLLASRPGDAVLREAMADCLLNLEDTERAVALLQSVAEEAWGDRDFRNARRLARRILEHDEDHTQAREWLEAIDSGEAERRIARRRRRKWLAAVMVVVGAVTAQLVRESYGLDALATAQHAVTSLLARDNDDAARAESLAAWAEVCEQHPMTSGGGCARELLEATLEGEIARMDVWMGWAAQAKDDFARTTTLARIVGHLARIDRIAWPDDDLTATWTEARDRLHRRVEALRAR